MRTKRLETEIFNIKKQLESGEFVMAKDEPSSPLAKRKLDALQEKRNKLNSEMHRATFVGITRERNNSPYHELVVVVPAVLQRFLLAPEIRLASRRVQVPSCLHHDMLTIYVILHLL
jgi:hypothetical protein